MTRLLVSVRDAKEAEICLRAGVDLIDVKDPGRGSLGAADPQTIRQVVALAGEQAPVSAALGELIDSEDPPSARWANLPDELRYAKLGLAGAARHSDWPRRLARAYEDLPRNVEPVAVVYADWRAAGAPSPAEVLHVACDLACPAVLLDTWNKAAGDLFVHWDDLAILDFIQSVQSQRRLAVVGGSLSQQAIVHLAPQAPDYFAVRGAACRGDRSGPIDASRVVALVELVRSLEKAHGDGKQNS